MNAHDIELFRSIRLVGNDGTELRFSTKSWSGRPVEHEIWISLNDGEIGCTCEDATCRKKRGHVLDMEPAQMCKHERLILSWVKASLERNLR